MKSYIIYPLYQAPGGPGTSPNNVVTAVGCAIRIEPIATQAGTGALFPGNRHVILDGAGQVSVPFSGSSWIPQRFTSFQFDIEMAGTNASDAWLVTVAEDSDDPGTYGGVGIPWSATYAYNAATKLYSGPASTTGAGSAVSIVQGGNTAIVNAGGKLETVAFMVPQHASLQVNEQGTQSTTPANISAGLISGTGICTGVVISNFDATNSLRVAIGIAGNIVATLAPGQSFVFPSGYVPDPNLFNIFVYAVASTCNYAATAFYTVVP